MRSTKTPNTTKTYLIIAIICKPTILIDFCFYYYGYRIISWLPALCCQGFPGRLCMLGSHCPPTRHWIHLGFTGGQCWQLQPGFPLLESETKVGSARNKWSCYCFVWTKNWQSLGHWSFLQVQPINIHGFLPYHQYLIVTDFIDKVLSCCTYKVKD